MGGRARRHAYVGLFAIASAFVATASVGIGMTTGCHSLTGLSNAKSDATDDSDDAGDETAPPRCGAGTALCGAVCTNVLLDRSNCGGCGIACEVGHTCMSGACVDGDAGKKPDGSPLKVFAIAAGDSFTCAYGIPGTSGLGLSAQLSCWGKNANGQLGDGTRVNRPLAAATQGFPAQVEPMTYIAAGGAHACAIVKDGSLRCWGSNESGQLGDGTNTPRTTPTAAMGLSAVAQVVAGAAHTCALLEPGSAGKGSVVCWGANANGQLGNGSKNASSTSVQVSGLTAGVQSIAAGGNHSCAVMTDGTIRCWGENSDGELGDGTTMPSAAAVTVLGNL
jgi:hypothetical protein